MRYLNRCINTLILAAAVAAPAVVMASPTPQTASVQVRVYDNHHQDYHNWDAREDHAYRSYLVVQHRSYRPYGHQNHKFQQNYWQWRHNHPDHN